MSNCPICRCSMLKFNLEKYGMCFTCYMKKKIVEGEKCSICNNKAVHEIQVIWKGKEKYIPRCKKHIVNNYKGEIKRLEKEEK